MTDADLTAKGAAGPEEAEARLRPVLGLGNPEKGNKDAKPTSNKSRAYHLW